MISSPYCAVSQPNVYKYYKRLTRWNANRCYWLRTTYLIFETFQTLFPTPSLIFTAVKVFIKWYIRKNEAQSFASKMAVHMKVWIYFMQVDAKCYILWRLTWNKTKVVNKFSRVRSTDWKSALKKFSTLKNTPFPLTKSIKVHRRALVLILCLVPYHRCEKSARESRNSHHLITQRDNIHNRARETCVDQRGYMTSK